VEIAVGALKLGLRFHGISGEVGHPAKKKTIFRIVGSLDEPSQDGDGAGDVPPPDKAQRSRSLGSGIRRHGGILPRFGSHGRQSTGCVIWPAGAALGRQSSVE